MNRTTTKPKPLAPLLLAALTCLLAAFLLIPTLVFATDAEETFDAPVTDVPADDDSLEGDSNSDDPVGASPAQVDSVGASSSSPAGEAGTPQPEEPPSAEGGDLAPEPTSYSLRLIVSADAAALRDGDAVLGSHDGVHLIGFADEGSLADAEAYYSETAEWAQRDIPVGVADDEAPEGNPAPVDETDNALSLLEDASDDGAPASGGKPLVALIDTGAPDDPAIVGSATFVGDDPADSNGHATAMLEAMKSEDPDVQVLAIKALGDDGRGSVSSVYAAIEYATEQGAQIINLSLAGYASDENAAIAEAVGQALENGIAVIAAAGNGGYDAAYFIPANIEGVFTVGACDEDGNVLDSSNRGDCVDCYVLANATSSAAARVSGWLSGHGAQDDLAAALISSGALGAIAPAAAEGGSGEVPARSDGDGLYEAASTVSVTFVGAGASGYSIDTRSNGNTDSYYFVKSCYVYYYNRYSEGTQTHQTSEFCNWTDTYYYNAGTEDVLWTYSNIIDRDDAYRQQYGEYVTRIDLLRGAINYPYEPRRFRGWYTGRYGTGTQLVAADGVIRGALIDYIKDNNVTGTLNLYQYWDAADYRVTLDPVLDSAEGATAGTSILYGVNGRGLYLDELCTTRGSITVPTKPGYYFMGYFTNPNGEGDRVINRDGAIVGSVDGDCTLYACWTTHLSQINLDSNGGSGGIEHLYWPGETYERGVVYRDPECTQLFRPFIDDLHWQGDIGKDDKPVRTGYTFVWWNATKDDADSTAYQYDQDNWVDGKTYYASWEPNNYTIGLDTSSSGFSQMNINQGSYYVHLRYNTAVYGDLDNGIIMTTTENPIETPSLSAKGHPFAGYYTEKYGQGDCFIDKNGYVTDAFALDWCADNDHVLYAYFDRDPLQELKFDKQGGTGGTDRVYFIPEGYDSDVFYDADGKEPLQDGNWVVTVPARTGYTFTGYYTQPNREGTQVVSKRWDEEDHKLSWVIADEFGSPGPYVIYAGWENNTYSIQLYDWESVGMYYSRPWNYIYENYGVSLYETDSNANMTPTANPMHSVPSFNDNYRFKGFYTEENGKGDRWIDENGYVTELFTNTSVTSDDVALYAYYEFIPSLRMYLDPNGGDGDTNVLYFRDALDAYERGNFYVDADRAEGTIYFPYVNGVIKVPSRVGYTFKGYAADAYRNLPYDRGRSFIYHDSEWGSGSRDGFGNEPDYGFVDGVTAYAFWEPNMYTVTLYAGNWWGAGWDYVYVKYDTGVSKDQYSFDSSLMSPTENPVRIPEAESYNYRFAGYYTEEGGKGECWIDKDGYRTDLFTNTSVVSDDVTLYAYYEFIPSSRLLFNDMGGSGGQGALYFLDYYNAWAHNELFYDTARTQNAFYDYIALPTKRGCTLRGYVAEEELDKDPDEATYLCRYYEGDNGPQFTDFSAVKEEDWVDGVTVYAMWVGNVYKVGLDASAYDYEGTLPTLYERFDTGVFLDEDAVDKEMSSTQNSVTVPSVEGLVFQGYYTEPDGKGVRLIDENGFITGDFSYDLFADDDHVLYAYMEPRTVLLPFAGGIGESAPLLWGSAIAVVAAAGFVIFRALRTPRQPVVAASRVRKPTPRRRTPAHTRMK